MKHLHPSPTSRGRIRRSRAVLPVLSVIVGSGWISACDYPTGLPILESRWAVPTEETRFGVGQLLPEEDVTFSPDSSEFIVDFDPVTFAESLGVLCPACALANGLNVPKPPFIGAWSSAIDFPPEVSALQVLGGEIELEIENGMNFDPLKPGGGLYGSMTLTVTDDFDGDVLATLTLDGATTDLPAGETLMRTLTLAPTTVEGAITAAAQIDSPIGDPITIDSSLEVGVTATPTNVRVGAVTVEVSGTVVSLDPRPLEFEDFDQELKDRIDSGAFVLEVTNPFLVSASFTVDISGPTIATIQKSASVPATAASTVTIPFTGDELRRFLGEPDVVLTGSGVIDPSAPAISVTPGQELVLSARMDLTLLIGGSDES